MANLLTHIGRYRGAIRCCFREIHPVFVEAGDLMDVELEDVFAFRLSYCRLSVLLTRKKMRKIRDGLAAQLRRKCRDGR